MDINPQLITKLLLQGAQSVTSATIFAERPGEAIYLSSYTVSFYLKLYLTLCSCCCSSFPLMWYLKHGSKLDCRFILKNHSILKSILDIYREVVLP